MTKRYLIRQLALADLEEIWLYTLSEWNLAQADTYIGSLLARMEWLADNPSTGKPRDDVKTGYFCFPEGSHLIFYIMTDGKVDVIGIPHQSMDVTQHLTS